MGHDLRLVFLHQAGSESSAYKMIAAIDGDPPLLQDVVAQGAGVQLQAKRGDMFLYGSDGKLALYLLARQPDYDFSEPAGYERFRAEVAAQF